ncbi:MAG TPA: hypothetical protein VED59_07775, partial [Acidimicrobiales bacterium]|nr:hypothetical protein [Acidimicrobiales bacterium]
MAQVTADFRHLVATPISAKSLGPYLQGADAAMASALAEALGQGPDNGFLFSGDLTVTGAQQVSPAAATVSLTDTFRAGAGAPFSTRYVVTAVLAQGRWKISWVTACMLVEDSGIVCPGPPPGVPATVPLPYSVTVRQSQSAQVHDLLAPEALAVEPGGDLLVADARRDEILRLDPDGQLSVFAGTGEPGFAGDGGPAVNAEFDDLRGIALSPTGTLYVADSGNCRVRAIALSGLIRTVAKGLCGVGAIALSRSGGLYVTTDSGYVDKVSPDGTVERAAGASGSTSVDSGHITPSTVVLSPEALAFDRDGDLDIWSSEPRAVFRLTPSGTISQVGADVYATSLAGAPDGSVLVATTGGAVERVAARSLVPYLDLPSGR